MPADARSLLRAAASERAKAGASGISDPFASYSSTGSLRCSACNYLTVKHESLWGAHVLSKSHRTNVAQIREEELREAELQRTKDGKRKAQDVPVEEEGDDSPPASRAGVDDEGAGASSGSKKARMEPTTAIDSTLSIDPDWQLFKSQMESPEPDLDLTADTHGAGAALEAEAQLISRDGADMDGTKADIDDVEELNAEELAAQERARKEQEEREEILSRLEEEQRQQDEADQRVSALKQRLQRIKQARLDKQKAQNKA